MLVSKRKRYLSGSDWVINTLDYMMKLTTCSGNMSQIVLMLNRPLDEVELRTGLNRFVKQFPVVEGHICRDIKLTPYWKIPESAEHDITLNVSASGRISSAEALLPMLAKSANSSFRDDREHMAFNLLSGEDRCSFAMTFDHRLFDAHGAESFLDLYNQSLDTKSIPGDISFTSSMELTEWKRKFLAGRNVNRRLITLSKSTPKALPVKTGRDRCHNYRLLSFTEEQTSAIYDTAYREAGYLMESPYFLAAITQAMHELFEEMQGDGSSYLIPVTADFRPGKDSLQEIFFNHVSYLFYQIPVEETGDMKGLIAMFKQQMYDQVKSGFPKDLAEASLLTRIVPPALFGKIFHIPVDGRIATFAFSHLGKSSYQAGSFMGSPIENLFHMPRVPALPGLGFFSNLYNNRLNLVISFLDGALTEEQVLRLEKSIKKIFGVSRS
jgi:hypothetical protein